MSQEEIKSGSPSLRGRERNERASQGADFEQMMLIEQAGSGHVLPYSQLSLDLAKTRH